MVLPTLQDLNLQAITSHNSVQITLVYFNPLSQGALWGSDRVTVYGLRSEGKEFKTQWVPIQRIFYHFWCCGQLNSTSWK